MKAVVIHEQGGLDRLIYQDWPDPEAGPGDVLVRVEACGLNHLDIFVRRGMPGFPVTLPFISGGDVAGVVAEVGEEVDPHRVAVGDRVVLNPSSPEGMLGESLSGGMAELVKSPASHAIPIPEGVGTIEAACLPVAYGTAWKMLRRGRLAKGETLLVLGASGGVGTAVVQIAKNLGARVLAGAGSREKCEKLLELGADEAIDYRETDFSREAWRLTEKRGVDCVVNYTGGETWVPSFRCLKKGGRLLTCGATAGFDPPTDIRYIWIRELEILGSDGWSSEDIRELLEEVRTGRIRPVVAEVLPLSQARRAEQLIEDRAVFGKVILEPDETRDGSGS